MTNEIMISIKGMSKSYHILDPDHKRSLGRKGLKPYPVFNNIDLEIRKGEVLGIVGRNGCGKSTFLKLVSKILKPDSGRIVINGKIASILELSMGFHSDLTGRENIFLRSELYGIRREIVEQNIEHIIQYADLGEFIDNPVRTYSSGMRSRLAFAIMVNVDADIFLVDEALSAGDAAFAAKASEHLKELIRSGKTILFTSHNVGMIERTCTRAIWLHEGAIRMDGDPDEVVAAYNHETLDSFEMTKSVAEGGSSSAQYRLATYYRDGIGVDADQEEYLKWLKCAADRSHIIAMSEYADHLMDFPSEENLKLARMYYKDAADNGNYEARRKYSVLQGNVQESIVPLLNTLEALAQTGDPLQRLQYGKLLIKSAMCTSDYQKGFQVLNELAEEGSCDAKFEVAMMLRNGTGTSRNIELAIEILKDLSEIGHPKAVTTLAEMYQDGKYVERDLEQAFAYFLRSATLGNAKSQYQIAEMYRDGIGVTQDQGTAEKWFAIYAESLLNDFRINAADSLFRSGVDTLLSAFDMMSSAAETYNNKALLRMGDYYSYGREVEKNPQKAFEYYEKGAQLIGRGKAPLADCYLNGKGTEVDLEKAFRLYTLAADAGDPESTFVLAGMYHNGQGTEANDKEYRRLIRLAAMRGHRESRELVEKWNKRNEKRQKARNKENPEVPETDQ